MTLLFVCLSVVLSAGVFWGLRRSRTAAWLGRLQEAKHACGALVESAQKRADQQRAEATEQAQKAGRARLEQGERELVKRRQTLERMAAQIATWDEVHRRGEQQLETRKETLSQREKTVEETQARIKAAHDRRAQFLSQASELLQKRAEDTFASARTRMASDWIEQVRAAGADAVRQVEQLQNTPELAVRARRLLEVSSQRYQGHYLTERMLSTLPFAEEVLERVLGPGSEVLTVIGEVANVKLALGDDKASVRLDGQDSLGREIARRTLFRLVKLGGRAQTDAAQRMAQQIIEELERETIELGRRAFRELEIPRAHPEIVKLVGRLNFRTSYSQNQWKHAVESAFLCGMLAAELRLDIKTARRAALLHDIGKSLTHAIDGSHAVIGADYARRLGENDLVANAIGAHHLDEPFLSPLALIVAASDAMSGGRPGARHEQEGSHLQRIEDLEAVAVGTPGVSQCYALQAGRELRVHVKEDQVSDARAAQLASELSRRIETNLVFPGNIRVTVIREINIVSTAN